MKLFFLIFLVVPLIEIYFLIQVGSMVGAGMTILLVVSTAVLGAFLVRAQGFSTFARVQKQLAKGQVPAMEMFEGLFLFVAGALLLTPGFFTDAIGFAFLTPPLRRKIIQSMMDRRMFRNMAGHTVYEHGHTEYRHADSTGKGRVIDVDYKKVD